jgi:hypothetical protein
VAEPGISLPPPAILHAVSASDTGRTRKGSEFSTDLPYSLVDILNDNARYSPNWNLALGHSDPAFALYKFSLHSYSGACLVDLEWLAPPDEDCAWVGLGNRTTNAWDWYMVPTGGQVYPASFDPYLYDGDRILAAVVIAHDTQRVLTTIRLGTAGVVEPLESAFGVFAGYAANEFDWFTSNAGLVDNAGYWEWVDNHFSILGAHWTRSNLQFMWDFIEPEIGAGYFWDNAMLTDGILANVYDSPAGVQMLAVIHEGIGDGDLRNPMADPTAHSAYVSAAVERFDGDGIDDATPSVNVRWWQVGNEIPDWLDSGRSALDYVDYFRHCRSAVLAADPAARLVLIAPTQAFTIDPFLNQVIGELATAHEFDAIDLHHWGPADAFRMQALPNYRSILDSHGLNDVEIWSCEHSTWSASPPLHPAQDETQQAQSLIKRCVWNRANGLDKLFWNSLVDWHEFAGDPGSIFNSVGLVSDGQFNGDEPDQLNQERRAYWSYRLLAEHIDNGIATFVGEVVDVHDEGEGIELYAYEFQRDADAERFFILWSDSGVQTVNLPVSGTEYQVTSLVTTEIGIPAGIDYLSPSIGLISFEVELNPLLIEPVPPLPLDAPPIYVTVVMHNEEPPGYPDFTDPENEGLFDRHRAALKDFVDMLDRHGVAFNWQSDWNFLQAIDLYDDGTDTDGLNIAEYICSLGFEVDPHAHQTIYNYADVAYWLDQVGVTPSGIAGGFVALPESSSELTCFWGPISGNHYDYTWQADVIWGGSYAYHGGDEELWAAGIWRPQDPAHFMVHDDAALVANIGSYNHGWQSLKLLIDQQQNGELIPGVMYTTDVFLSQKNLVSEPGRITDFEAELLEVMEHGDLVWMGLSAQYAEWQTTYNSVPNIHRFVGYE